MWATVAAAAASGLAVLLYWRAVPLRGAGEGPSPVTLVAAAAGLALCALSATLGRPDYTYARETAPITVAIAFDLSPSMLAVPDPTFDQPLPPRYRRAQDVLLRVFGALEERGTSVLVSSIGFTRDAGVLMGWSGDATQIRSVLEHGLSPGLFTRTGTSLEEAVEMVLDVFDTLPQGLRDESRRVAILVSDGEDTTRRTWLPFTLDRLSSSSLEVVALQAGSLQHDEGVPRYGELGEFLGFERMSGRTWTVPDAQAMAAIARAPARGGLYVRAENPDAAEQIVQFLDGSRSGGTDGKMLTFALLWFAITCVLCARVLR